MSEDLWSIGAFALVTGLSVTALRHYDEVGVLRPVSVDPVTGYRRYSPDQVRAARLICALRRADLPIDAIREVLAAPAGEEDRRTAEVLARHRARLTGLLHAVDNLLEDGVVMTEVKAPRIVQAAIGVADLPAAVAFYAAAFGASYQEEISSFEFGTWPSDGFCLLTVAESMDGAGPTGPARFGLLVPDVDAAHRRALDAGGTEVYPPVDKPWKPRSSCVADPSGNHIDLYQG